MYLGHPNGDSEWTRNLAAAGEGTLVIRGAEPVIVRPIRLVPGAERKAVILATSQHPFPGKVFGASRFGRCPGGLLRPGGGQFAPLPGGFEFLLALGELIPQCSHRVGELGGQGLGPGQLLLKPPAFLCGRFGGIFGILEHCPGPLQRGGSGPPRLLPDGA